MSSGEYDRRQAKKGAMKEFFVGLAALLVLAAMAGGFFLLLPFLLVMTFFLKFFLIIALPIFCVWILGKFIVMLFEDMKERK